MPVQGGLAPQLPPAPIDDVWDRHGRSAYALACALLGDEDAATGVVRLAIQDYARSAVGVPADEERRVLTRHVYWRSREVALAPRTMRLPDAMVWIGQLAHLQRASLALCTFGGLTHREAAELLGVPPIDVARSLTAGLQELGHLATGSASA